MAKHEAIPQEVHERERAGAVARTLMRMSYKPLKTVRQGDPADPLEPDKLLKEEKPSKE